MSSAVSSDEQIRQDLLRPMAGAGTGYLTVVTIARS